MAVPRFDDLFNPLLVAMHALGGSASIQEIEERVALDLGLSETDLSVIHNGNTTKFEYNLAWARSYLKNCGILETIARGIWALSEKGKKVKTVNSKEIKKIARDFTKLKKQGAKNIDVQDELPEEDLNEEIVEMNWENQAIEAMKKMLPNAFENLCKRILLLSGFVQVEVTGKSHDGGIDGRGVLKLELLSFYVAFQCKRYKDTPVGSSAIREFRGSMDESIDKGIIITTASFTREAQNEARVSGKKFIDLIDGKDLVQILEKHQIGIKTETVKIVKVNTEFFLNF